MYAHGETLSDRRAAVLSSVVSSVKRREPHQYLVSLVGYYIEGVPYAASALSVDPATTPVIELTDRGFLCQAYFPPESLDADIVKRKGIVTREVGGQAAKSCGGPSGSPIC